MPSALVNLWITDIQNKIDYWFHNYPTTPGIFAITPLPHAPLIHPNILSHSVSSTCPSPPFPHISFDHFPEPYYGNPDDDIEKLAVVLFYNPGPSGASQLLTARGTGTFYENYRISGFNYFDLSSHLRFCHTTISRFWNPKNNQLLNLFSNCHFDEKDLKPLFMDLVPWHSDSFTGINQIRFNLPNCVNEVSENVFLPAILNAQNSAISHYLNELKNSTSKIILFAIGAKYSNNFLAPIGFDDITLTIPSYAPHTLMHGGVIQINGGSSRMKVWKINGSQLKIEGIQNTELNNKEIFVINMWTRNIGMDIPKNASQTLNHVLQNL